jgi:hypothetical protein
MPGRKEIMDMERKHYVLTYMDESQDGEAARAEYQGEFQDFPVKVAYWDGRYLIAPSWFDTEADARNYVEFINNSTAPKPYYMVQERHYIKGDPRIAVAKIILGPIEIEFYPHPERGETQERFGDPMIDVWTMYFMGREQAAQYVKSFNADVAAARLLSEASA